MHSYYAGVSPKMRLFPRKGPHLKKWKHYDFCRLLGGGGHNASFKHFLFTQLEGGINFNGKKVSSESWQESQFFWTTSHSFVQMSSIQTKPTRCINSTAPLFCQHNHYSRACFKPELHKYIFFKVKEHFLQVWGNWIILSISVTLN